MTRVLVPFSGQPDSVDLVASCSARLPGADLELLFVENVGVRASFAPPYDTARTLARQIPRVGELAVRDARPVQVALLAAMPSSLSSALGVRTMCATCQLSLLLVSIAHARERRCVLAYGARESLGRELDAALRAAALSTGIELVEIASEPRPRRLAVVSPKGQRCALTPHHGAAPLGEGVASELTSWMLAGVAANGAEVT